MIIVIEEQTMKKKIRETRSRRKTKCDAIIKTLVSHSSHKKCYDGRQKAVKNQGKRLNTFMCMKTTKIISGKNDACAPNLVSSRNQVFACHTLFLLIQKHVMSNSADLPNLFSTTTKVTPPSTLLPSLRIDN